MADQLTSQVILLNSVHELITLLSIFHPCTLCILINIKFYVMVIMNADSIAKAFGNYRLSPFS